MSERYLDTHYKIIHKNYVDLLNISVGEFHSAIMSGDFLKYTDLSRTIQFLGGGHANHEFFWDGLVPIKQYGGVPPPPESELYRLLLKSFGGI